MCRVPGRRCGAFICLGEGAAAGRVTLPFKRQTTFRPAALCADPSAKRGYRLVGDVNFAQVGGCEQPDEELCAGLGCSCRLVAWQCPVL